MSDSSTIEQYLEQWHRVVADNDFDLLAMTLADDVEFHSIEKPRAFK